MNKKYIFLAIPFVVFIALLVLTPPPPAGGAYSHAFATGTQLCPENTPIIDSTNQLSLDYLQRCYNCILALTPTGTQNPVEYSMTQQATNIQMTQTEQAAYATLMAEATATWAQLTATNDPNYTPFPTSTLANTATPANTPTPSEVQEIWLGSPVGTRGCIVSDNQGYVADNQYIDVNLSMNGSTLMGIIIQRSNVVIAEVYGASTSRGRIFNEQIGPTIESANNWDYGYSHYGELYRSDNSSFINDNLPEIAGLYGHMMDYEGYLSEAATLKTGVTVEVEFKELAYARESSPDSKIDTCSDLHIIPVYYGQNMNQPTPTPTPEPHINDCLDYEYEEKIQVVKMGEWGTYDGECFTILPGANLDMPGEESEQIGWPEVQVCPVYIVVPELEIFGMVIPLEIFAFVFVVFLISLIMKI